MQKRPERARKAAKKKRKSAVAGKPSAAKRAAAKKDAGTERWPKECLGKGDWLQVPKSVIQRLGEFDMKPHHLWLLLALQADRFRDRPPRYYWAALAEWAGVKPNTVRRWGYELRDKGLLTIKQNRKPNPGETRRTGHRNERNEFHLRPFELRTKAVHKRWKKDREQRRNGAGRDTPSD